MIRPEQVIEQLPENVYVKSNTSIIYCLLNALLTSAGKLESRAVQTYLDLFIRTCRFEALDRIWGNIFKIYRLPGEKYPYLPYTEELTPEEWEEINAKDSRYRNRLLSFISAVCAEGKKSIKLAAQAATGYPVEVYDQYQYGAGIMSPVEDPEGKFEFVIVPYFDTSTEDEFKIRELVNRIKPVHTLFYIDSSLRRVKEIGINNIYSSSNFCQVKKSYRIDEYFTEFESENRVSGLQSCSSELTEEQKMRKKGRDVITPNAIKDVTGSGSPYVRRNIDYHSSSAVCWYGEYYSPVHQKNIGPKIYGHYGIDAFNDDINTYWLSVGNGQPNLGYSFEWIEAEVFESGEGRGINEVWVKLPYPNMSMWISIMDTNGNWYDLGGNVIPYDPTHTAAYPNGADIPYVMYIPNTGNADDANSWHKYNLGKWFENVKYVRVTFTNLYYSGIGTYKYRAAVSGFRVYANLEQYYSYERLIDYTSPEKDVPWISQEVDEQNSNAAWVKFTLNKKQEINKIRITVGNRGKGQVVDIKDGDGNMIKSGVALNSLSNLISFTNRTMDSFYIYSNRMNMLPILSNKFGLEIVKVEAWMEEHIPGEEYSVFRKPHPAQSVCDKNRNTYWQSQQYYGSRDSLEYVELYLTPTLPKENPAYTQINRVAVHSLDPLKTIDVLYAEPRWNESKNKYDYIWRYAPVENRQEISGTTSIIKFSSLVNAGAIRVEFPVLAKQPTGLFSVRIAEIIAWARIDGYNSEYSEEDFYHLLPEKAIDNNPNTLWRSGPNIFPDSVEYLILDVDTDSAVSYFHIDPEFPGMSCCIYYTNEDYATRGDNTRWTPIYKDYRVTRELLELPYPIKSKYWKLEFSDLQPQIYTYTNYESYKKRDLRKDELVPLLGYNLGKPKFEDNQKHDYTNRELIASLPQAYYAGVRELRVLGVNELGLDIFSIEEHFVDDKRVDSSTTMIFDPENDYLRCVGSGETPEEFVFQSTIFNLASNLKSIMISTDERGEKASWFATRDGINWYNIDIVVNEDKWFVFPETDTVKDQFAVKCVVNVTNTKDYILNNYAIKLNYYNVF